jgi:hypothetical protein
LTKPVIVKFDDQAQEKVRANHEQRITELQNIIADLTSDATAQVPTSVAKGRWLNRQILTKTSGAYTSTPGTNMRLVRQIGGGGGGGAANGTAGSGDATGGSGNSGWYIEYRVPGDDTLRGTYTIGAAGAAGIAPTGNGGNGGDTTFTINGKTYIAKGGTGGIGALNFNGGSQFPVAGSTQPPDVDFVCCAVAGAGFMGLTGGVSYSGASGGVFPFGAGAPPANAGPAGGGPGIGYGAGGGGGSVNFFSINGSAGTVGVIVVDEFS